MIPETYPRAYFYRRIVQAKLFIDQHYAAPIAINNIAREAFLSKYHFIRQFKKIYGKTPYQYLTAVRIEKAMQLLHTGVSVSEVCYSVGYDSITSFSTLFKRVIGISPSVFSSQQQQVKVKLLKKPLQFVPGCFAEKKGWLKNSNFQEVF